MHRNLHAVNFIQFKLRILEQFWKQIIMILLPITALNDKMWKKNFLRSDINTILFKTPSTEKRRGDRKFHRNDTDQNNIENNFHARNAQKLSSTIIVKPSMPHITSREIPNTREFCKIMSILLSRNNFETHHTKNTHKKTNSKRSRSNKKQWNSKKT